MRKRVLALWMAGLLLLSGCGGSEPEVPESPSKQPPQAAPTEPNVVEPNPAERAELTALRDEIEASGALMGVAYLGWAELPYFADVSVYLEANGFGETYPFLYEIPENDLVRQEGCELYAVVPASSDVKLTVYEHGMGEYDERPKPGKELLTVDDGRPVLLMGNVSDIVPDLFVRAEKTGERTVEYAPQMSLASGDLVPGEGVYDATPYDVLGRLLWHDMGLSHNIFCGTRYARHVAEGGKTVTMILTLEEDGRAEYSYGNPNSETLEQFEGSWRQTDDMWHLELSLVGGAHSTPGSEASGEAYEIAGRLSLDFNNKVLSLTHEHGDALLFGTEGETYRFLPFDSFQLVGDWNAEAVYRDWIYKLSLRDNTECTLSLCETDGEMLVSYDGWWFMEDGMLDFFMARNFGEHPETPEWEVISGQYRVEMFGPDVLTLEYSHGDILTLNMEEYYSENFMRVPEPGAVSVYYAEQVTADWANCDWVNIDDTVPVEAAFCTMVPVEEFKVVSLTMRDDLSFEAAELFDYGTLNPERPLRVIMTIYGTIPSYGISYVDPSGVHRLYGVSMSGLDGSLELMEIN